VLSFQWGLRRRLQGHEFVAALCGLFLESRLKPLFSHLVTVCPRRGVVLDLLAHHHVEDDGNLVRCRGNVLAIIEKRGFFERRADRKSGTGTQSAAGEVPAE
jgi:hypothetical protein